MCDININISGGNSKFNNIIQGDNNSTNTTNDWHQKVQEQFNKIKANINFEANKRSLSETKITEIENEIQQLEDLINKGNIQTSSIKKKKEWLKEHFEWTIPILKPLFELVIPNLIKS